jgi:hypothetical protein
MHVKCEWASYSTKGMELNRLKKRNGIAIGGHDPSKCNPNPNPNPNPAVDLPLLLAMARWPGWLVEIYYYMTEGGRGAQACWFSVLQLLVFGLCLVAKKFCKIFQISRYIESLTHA